MAKRLFIVLYLLAIGWAVLAFQLVDARASQLTLAVPPIALLLLINYVTTGFREYF